MKGNVSRKRATFTTTAFTIAQLPLPTSTILKGSPFIQSSHGLGSKLLDF